MRGKRRKKPLSAFEQGLLQDEAREIAQAKADYAHALAVRIKRIKRTALDRKSVAKSAIRGFRPRRSDRGTIIFVGTRGGRISGASQRKGFAVYVTKSGRKQFIRQYDRKKGRVERTPTPRKLTTLDISTVRNKSAKKRFLTTHLNPSVRAILRKKGKGISQRGTRYAGKIKTNKFYEKADVVGILAKELARASNSQKSKRDFLVTIGISVKDGTGRHHWIEIQRRFSRQDGQRAYETDLRSFFGREIYAFLAKELSDRDLVLQGSARHIGRLKENRGKKRSRWEKDGFLWQGHDQKDVSIESLEYRFDQLTLTS